MLKISDINEQIEKMKKIIPFDLDQAYIETVNTEKAGAVRVKVMFKSANIWITMETSGGVST